MICFCAVGFVFAEGFDGDEKLNSQFVAGIFHDIAFERLNTREVSKEQVEQAMVFLVAASEFDSESSYINETILNASSLLSDHKYDESIHRAFEKYCRGDADLIVAGKAISHFLADCGSSQQRRKVLSDLLSNVADQNVMLRLDISTRLGLSATSSAKELLDSLAADYRAIDPQQAISVNLALPTKTSFGLQPDANLLISNKMTDSLVIFDKGLFKGGIRVDAEVRGDVNANIYELISKRIQPGRPVKVGEQISVPLRVINGRLRRILEDHPQASLEIKFTVYLDPVVDLEGNVESSLKGIDPIVRKFRRPGLSVDNRYLIKSLSELSKGRFEEKIRSVRLFTGLSSEQNINTGPGRRYRSFSVEPSFLTNVITSNIGSDDWMIRTGAIYNLLDRRPPLDFEITRAVSDNINDKNWPVRMVALYMLSKTQSNSFMPVLEWKAKNDPDLNVRWLAEVLLRSK
ncbi:MAG: HEAT repeat domain-containing protein [Phycisphaerae bacterium]|nr:HEAT repeat domain-containing protein [Phycisphaerae bacterium]